jgi:hypothetical protein
MHLDSSVKEDGPMQLSEWPPAGHPLRGRTAARHPGVAETRHLPRRWRNVVLTRAILLLLLLVAPVGIAGYVAWQLTHPARDYTTQTPAAAGPLYRDVQAMAPGAVLASHASRAIVRGGAR